MGAKDEVGKNILDEQVTLLSGHTVGTLFDIGANIGGITRSFRESFPHALVYSFEPFANVYEKLREAFKEDPLVRPIQVAMADRKGTRLLYVNRTDVTNSLFPVDQEGRSGLRIFNSIWIM